MIMNTSPITPDYIAEKEGSDYAQVVLAQFFYVTFSLFVFFILINLFLAIVLEAYSQVATRAAGSASLYTELRLLLKRPWFNLCNFTSSQFGRRQQKYDTITIAKEDLQQRSAEGQGVQQQPEEEEKEDSFAALGARKNSHPPKAAVQPKRRVDRLTDSAILRELEQADKEQQPEFYNELLQAAKSRIAVRSKTIHKVLPYKRHSSFHASNDRPTSLSPSGTSQSGRGDPYASSMSSSELSNAGPLSSMALNQAENYLERIARGPTFATPAANAAAAINTNSRPREVIDLRNNNYSNGGSANTALEYAELPFKSDTSSSSRELLTEPSTSFATVNRDEDGRPKRVSFRQDYDQQDERDDLVDPNSPGRPFASGFDWDINQELPEFSVRPASPVTSQLDAVEKGSNKGPSDLYRFP